jgi:hypothetical protein
MIESEDGAIRLRLLRPTGYVWRPRLISPDNCSDKSVTAPHNDLDFGPDDKQNVSGCTREYNNPPFLL